MSYRHALVDVLEYVEFLQENLAEEDPDDEETFDAGYDKGYLESLDGIREHVIELLVNPEE